MKELKFKPLCEGVNFTIDVQQDDSPVRGNVVASGDDALDKKIEDEIIERLDHGDIWAWCQVKITASWNGFEGHDYLGGCSYKSEADFIESNADGYYPEMKTRALEALNMQIEELLTKLADRIYIEGE